MPKKTASGTLPKSRKKVTYVSKPIPDDPLALVRLPSVLAVLGISKTSFYEGIKTGKYPSGKLLSQRCRVWSAAQIRDLLSSLEEEVAV